ncbi:3-carboxy-cis,cis-muconate cycloisomerase [Kibdelosporangium phytohabitans]|uniref:3-carboxy-cis,cis-muconate cycloisomerase n=1 Tax=Kibdelosporangium phytohabitans TaxID=860235 RepID=UPI000A4AFFB9|nr:3-carboxy-cis,cis-muconate cycloisomerase [Kibdelosporangium phytohabitans]MBE1464271.1 3-carboxy-cis,cis-muconate cycloisomerase [Kibdelosporangium phytohabitans]
MFEALFGSRDEDAWLTALVDAEKALAAALAKAGVIPAEAASEIARVPVSFDAAELGRQALGAGNPVVPLVRRLRAQVSSETARYVHFGATSQDIMDTAAMLVAKNAVGAMLTNVDASADACAALADEHRDTVMIARTLMQHALPTTFGLKCAGWLVALDEAAANLRRLRFTAQLGGAVGTLSVFGDTTVPRLFAAELGLDEPVIPWHTNRTRMGELAGAFGVLGGVLGKIALDVTLLAQTEVGEVAESSGGGSSTMPHKQNPVRSVLITAATRQVPGLVATMLAAMPQEHERAAGAWHAEWETLNSMCGMLSTACARTRDLLTGLRVDRERMRANVDMTGGLVMAEAVVTALAPAMGRATASEVVTELATSGRPFRSALLTDPRISLSEEDIDKALDPAAYLGAANELTDRALRR